MAVLKSEISTRSASFEANRKAMLAAIDIVAGLRGLPLMEAARKHASAMFRAENCSRASAWRSCSIRVRPFWKWG